MPALQLVAPPQEQAWLIESGVVDVFAIPLQPGRVSGAPRHLCRVRAGQVVFSIRRETEGSVRFIARGGAEATLRELTREQILNAPELSAWLEAWVSGLAQALAREMPPQASRAVGAEAQSSAEAEEILRGAESVQWIQLAEGVALFFDQPHLPVPTAQCFPLTGNLWVRVRQPSRMDVLDTQACLAQGALWPGLEAFHQTLAIGLQHELGEQNQSARARLNAVAQADGQAVERALTQLAAVMHDARARQPLAASDETPLLAACRLIGRQLHLEIQAPPASATARTRRDPLGAIARASRLRLRRVALRGQWWRQDNGPLLAHVEADKRPIALLWETNRRYVWIDPAHGARQPVTPALAETLEPFAHSFFRPFPNRALNARALLQFGLQGSGSDVAALALTGAALGALGLAPAFLTNVIFDSIIPAANQSRLLWLTLMLSMAALGSGLFQLVRSLAVLRLETRLGVSTQAALWDRILNLPVSFFTAYSAGDLATRIYGLDMLRQILAGVTGATILTGVFSLFNLAALFYYDAYLAAWAVALMGLAAALTLAVGAASLRLTRALNAVRSKIAGLVLQLVSGVGRLRVAGAEARAFAAWAERFAAQRRLAFEARTLGIGMSVFNAAFPTLALVAVFVTFIGNGSSLGSTGALLAFIYALGSLLTGVLSLSQALPDVLRGLTLFEHARPILQAVPEVGPHKAYPGELNGRLEISHVTFRYKASGPLILEDVSLEAKPGEFIAIVGPSGSGKSTLLRLLLGFETPESGSIYYDGQDIAMLDLSAVRHQVGVVLQSGSLIPGDIFNNIVGSSLLTLADAWEAARLAGLEADIKLMPMGMYTVVSEGGSTFSEGQRQRLMIARALVNRPRLIFFDEATSALDNRTQAIVSASLKALQATRLVIAHRLSTIQHADRIYVLQHGRVAQVGLYAELAAQTGPFRDLIKRQVA